MSPIRPLGVWSIVMDNVVTGLMVAMLLTMGVAVVIIRMGAVV